MIYNDKQSPFEELIEKDDSVSLHDRNIQYHAVEMYKVSNGLSPRFISDKIKHKNSYPYNLRHDLHNLSFPDLLLKLCFMGPRAYLIWVQ